MQKLTLFYMILRFLGRFLAAFGLASLALADKARMPLGLAADSSLLCLADCSSSIRFLVASIFIISSCAKDEVSVNPDTNKQDSLSTARGVLPTDSLNIKHGMQSMSDLILADRIVYKDSKYVLDLSKEEASDLSIPEIKYQEYVDRVEEMNYLVNK